MDAILDTIDAALRQKGLTDAAASKLAVGHASLIKNLRLPRDGEKRYNLPSLMKLAEVLDLEFYFGPKRPDEAELAPHLLNLSPADDAPTGFLTIPWVDFGTRKGSAPVAFARAWLDSHNLKPDFLQAASPDDVKLFGIGSEDAIALLDTRAALRKGHGVWCLRSAGRVQVCHVTFKGAVTVIHSGNADDGPHIIEGPAGGAITMLGKVVWLGQSIPFKGVVG